MWPFRPNSRQVSSVLGVMEGSPFYLLNKHMRSCLESVKILEEFMIAYQNCQDDRLKLTYGEIIQKEHDADDIKNKLKVHLHKGLFLPVSRSDILSILTAQDNIANTCKDVSGILYGRDMAFPEFFKEDLVAFVSLTIQACQNAYEVVQNLTRLVETGFGDRQVQDTELRIQSLDKLEEQTDLMQISLRKKLRAHENEMSPVDVIFWYQALEKIGNLADWSQRVGSKLLILLAR
ncbi:MAG: TIGR00153 family protein [Candidatus Comchoanobacterales bacterium]